MLQHKLVGYLASSFASPSRYSAFCTSMDVGGKPFPFGFVGLDIAEVGNSSAMFKADCTSLVKMLMLRSRPLPSEAELSE